MINIKDDKILLRYENYIKKNDLVFSFNNSALNNDLCLLGKNPLSKTCIFCLKSEPEITLDCRSHAIPTFLGNKYLYNRLECRECNKYFGDSIETQLDIFSKPYRLLNGIKRRKNKEYTFLKYQSSSQKFLVHNLLIGEINAIGVSGKDPSEFLESGNDNIEFLNFEGKFRFSDVYKSFMKIIYGLMPEKHHSSFTSLRDWIMNKDPEELILNQLTVFITLTPDPLKEILFIHIFKRNKNYYNDQNSEQYFDYTAHIAFGNLHFDIPLLSDSTLNFLKNNGGKSTLKLDLYSSVFNLKNSEIWKYNFSDNKCTINKQKIMIRGGIKIKVNK